MREDTPYSNDEERTKYLERKCKHLEDFSKVQEAALLELTRTFVVKSKVEDLVDLIKAFYLERGCNLVKLEKERIKAEELKRKLRKSENEQTNDIR